MFLRSADISPTWTSYTGLVSEVAYSIGEHLHSVLNWSSSRLTMVSIRNGYTVDGPFRYGFIGLGVMGWGMANNLRAKIPASASLCVCEISEERLNKWLAQAPGSASVAATPKEVVEQSVSHKVLFSNHRISHALDRTS